MGDNDACSRCVTEELCEGLAPDRHVIAGSRGNPRGMHLGDTMVSNDGTRAEHCGIVVVLSRQLLIPPHSMQAEASGGTSSYTNQWVSRQNSGGFDRPSTQSIGCLLQHSRPVSTTCGGILCFDTVAHCRSQVCHLYVLSLQTCTAVLARYCTAMRHHTGDRRFILCPNTLQCWHSISNQNCVA